MFNKTVLLVIRHGNSGPLGVIVNRPQSLSLDKIFPAYPAAQKFSLFNGGPVYPEQLFYLVRGGDDVAKGSVMISANIYLAFDTSLLGELLGGNRHYTDLRVMHGVAAWAPGQLESEIKRGDWYVMPFEEAVIFDLPPEDMWQELHHRTNRAQEF